MNYILLKRTAFRTLNSIHSLPLTLTKWCKHEVQSTALAHVSFLAKCHLMVAARNWEHWDIQYMGIQVGLPDLVVAMNIQIAPKQLGPNHEDVCETSFR